MFRIREDELILKKHIHKQMLGMFRNTLTKVATIKQDQLHIETTARFQGDEFGFAITVFALTGGNTTLDIYSFWEIEQSQQLVDSFISAIKTGDFEKVQAAPRR
jgi:hypothetical protein